MATYTIFDTETTGLYPQGGDRIVEIAAIKIIDGQITPENFITLIHPERTMPYEASRVNGITDEMLQDAPVMKEILPYFMEFVGNSTLVAHNAKFDMKFLTAELDKCGLAHLQIPESICTVELSKKLFPYQRYHNLDEVTGRLGIEISDRHRALGDVLATAQVFLKFAEMEKII